MHRHGLNEKDLGENGLWRLREKISRDGCSWIFAGSLDALRHAPPNQIALLDSLRSIAILLVVNHHFSSTFVTIHGDNFYSRLPFVVNGWSGVDLFFVLSGFFIGSQLWKELRKSGTICIHRFILRRGLRIWPLYFFTYFCVLMIYWQNAIEKQYGWADLVFLANYFNYGIVLGGWSLCTEEQFYILAPILLFFLARKASLNTGRVCLLFILGALPLVRATVWIHHKATFFSHDPALFSTIYYKFHTHCDGLIMGLIISNLWVSRDHRHIGRFKPSLVVLGGFVFLVLLRQLQHEVFIFSGLALFFGSLVWFGLTSNIRLFQSRAFYWISRLSFGMYLNHAYLLDPIAVKVMPRISLFPASSVSSQLLGTALLTVASAGIAFVTFCLVEHPFLNLRKVLLDSPSLRKTSYPEGTL